MKRIEVRGESYRVTGSSGPQMARHFVYKAENDGTLNIVKHSLDGKPPEEVAKFGSK